MNITGLEAILEKEEIVQTQRADELLARPEMVDQRYTQYVRSYIPLGQQGEAGRSVQGFERGLIRDIKAKKVPRGYITADYGYGKTSTALYLWQQARQANILAVPPFRLVYLHDIITATYGWLQYELQRTRPDSPLLARNQTLYENTMQRNVETVADKYNMSRSDAQRLIQDRPQVLEFTEGDYMTFLTNATHITLEAGFEGLFVLADEVQQYIDPEVKAGIRDPLSPLFNLISGFITRRSYEPMGIMFVIPPRELETLRGQRGDFNQRVQPGLDLRTIYSRDFPQRLWSRLAEQFEFQEVTTGMVSEETLRALGQISMRSELSDGPRTVVNTFKRITRRYLEQQDNPNRQPYQPIDLIEDFLAQRITFDSSQKIRRYTNQALDHHLVKGYADREQVVKWAAAFPEEGLRRSRYEALGLTQAVDELMQSANREILIGIGERTDRAVTLRDYRQDKKTDGISLLIDEFWRQYEETVDQTRLQAMAAFFALLKQKVFPDNQWRVQAEQTDDLLTQNQSLTLEGHFRLYSRTFPERLIQVRLLWEDEAVKDLEGQAELVVQIRLRRHFDQPEAERRSLHDPLTIDYNARQINLTVNLLCLDEASLSPNLDETMRDIIEPYKMTPLLMLNLYSFIDEKRRNNQLDQTTDSVMTTGFQPDLLDNTFRLLFNPIVGRPVEAAAERILELATEKLFQQMYPDYHTLIKVGNWTSSLGKYRNALKRLELPQERQGQMSKEGSKPEIAEMFALTATAFDTLSHNFGELLTIEKELTTNKRDIEAGKKGAIRFTLHPLERAIKEWLKDAPVSHRAKEQPIHAIPKHELYERARQKGYRDKEISQIIDLMTDRDLIEENHQGYIQETANPTFSVDELVAEIQAWQADLETLLQGYDSSQLTGWQEEAQKALIFANDTLRGQYKAGQDVGAQRKIRQYRQELSRYVKERLKALQNNLHDLKRNLPQPNPQQGKTLEQAVQGGVSYVEQVNDLRSRLSRRYSDLAGKASGLQQRVTDLVEVAKSEDLPLAKLVQTQQTYQTLKKEVDPLKSKCDTFSQDFNHFVTWKTLVDRGSELSNETQQLGDLVQPQMTQLRTLFNEIRGHLSAHKEDALPEAHQFETQLQEIKQTVRRIKTEATTNFNDLQDRYQTILRSRLKFKGDAMWRTVLYNPTSPGDSYQTLYYEVQQAVDHFHQQLDKSLIKLQADTHSILQSPLLRELPTETKSEVETTATQTVSRLQATQQQLKELSPKIETTQVIEDFPSMDGGQFVALVGQYEPILATINESSGQVRQLQQQITATIEQEKLSPSEETLLNSLQTQSGQLELSQLRANVTMPDDQFWHTLRQLYEKQHLRLFSEVIRRE